jgi:hypothetical protein
MEVGGLYMEQEVEEAYEVVKRINVLDASAGELFDKPLLVPILTATLCYKPPRMLIMRA